MPVKSAIELRLTPNQILDFCIIIICKFVFSIFLIEFFQSEQICLHSIKWDGQNDFSLTMWIEVLFYAKLS